MRIAIDLDSTVADLSEAICDEVYDRFGKSISQLDFFNWDLVPVLGLTDEEVVSIIRAAIRRNYKPIRGAREAMATLSKWHEVVIFTNRLPDELEYTETWLKENWISYDRILLESQWNIMDEKWSFDVLLDDCIEKLLRMKSWVTRPIIFTRPWNVHCKDIKSRFERASNWPHFVRLIERRWML